MKYLIVPGENIDLKVYQKFGADSFIFGLQNYSVNYPEISLEKIVELSKMYSIFVALNKNIRNEELKDLENVLGSLSNTSICGVLFYDLSILSIVQRKKLRLPLVWHQTHMVTNYQTCNYYFDQGVEYGITSNEITLNEILEMKKKTKMKLMTQILGYPIMSHSRRKLIENYFKDIKEKPDKEIYTLTEKSEESFLIRESHAGTSILFGKPMNGTRVLYELLDHDFEFAILDMTFLTDSTGLEMLKLYQEIRDNFNQDTPLEREKKINKSISLIGDFTNFFDKKTIYKVKRG